MGIRCLRVWLPRPARLFLATRWQQSIFLQACWHLRACGLDTLSFEFVKAHSAPPPPGWVGLMGLGPQHRYPGQMSGNQEKESLGWGHCLLKNCSNNSPRSSTSKLLPPRQTAEHLPLVAQAKEARARNACSHHLHIDPSHSISTSS